MKRKYPAIDLMKLLTDWDVSLWNNWLNKCLKNGDMEKLKATLYGLQAGMDILAKQKLNTDDVCKIYFRLTHSIEKTVKSILREKYSLPDMKSVDSDQVLKWRKAKQKRNLEFQKFLKEASF